MSGPPPKLTPEERAAITSRALAMGDMRPIMTRTQRIAHKLFESVRANVTIFVIDCSRRWGKTYFDAMEVHGEAKSAPGRIIRYVAPTKLHGRQFVIPAFAWLFAQLPEAERPRFVGQDNTWIWPNGSVCHLGSAETMADVEAQVGTACHKAIVDEAGKIRTDILKHLVLSVLLPQFLTTGGNILITSTPALMAAHQLAKLVATARVNGSLVTFTLDDCDHITDAAKMRLITDLLSGEDPDISDDNKAPSQRVAIGESFVVRFKACTTTEERIRCIREHGGPNATVVLRELYCVRVTERSQMVIPEWSDVASVCVRAAERPDFVDWYVVGDFGFDDMTVIGFMWLDFVRARLVIEDELAFQGVSGLAVGYAVKAKEEALGIVRPKRFADATPQLLADLAHPTLGPAVAFGPVMKDDSEAALNALRMRIAQCHVEIDPRCKVLLSHLENGTWNAGRTSFERIPGFGHFDGIDMLKYAVRSVDWKKNPMPTMLPGVSIATHHVPAHITEQMQRSRAALRQVGNRR